jgi:hypothetical protein
MLTQAYGANPVYGPDDILSGVDWWDNAGTGGLIPDPTRDGTPYYVNGVVYSANNRNGGVNVVYNTKQKVDFYWTDGHLSKEYPVSTNSTGQDDSHNYWDAFR